jgi:hypothetical protein
MSDFDSANLLSDWNAVLARAGALTATCGGVTFSGVWAEQQNMLDEIDDQFRSDKRFTVFTTVTQLPTVPAPRTAVVRSGVTYSVMTTRTDAEGCGIELDVRRVI